MIAHLKEILMPKTLGEWLFLASVGIFSLVGGINVIVATFGFTGTLILGYREGFDPFLIAMGIIFGLLLAGDLMSILIVKPERILKSVPPNLFVALVRGVYLSLAGFLFYGLLWDGGLAKYYWVYLVVAVWLTLVNLPWMIFHLALCVPKCRNRMAEIDAKTRCICSEECDCQNPPPDNWDGKDGVYHISNKCPMHNLNPKSNPDCPIHNSAD